ncbi:hypothetical protein DPMN_012072 [Dreissena polymorpha]|uniref:Uncharacterized protein n=1 Tax=Dreissena polymorpha TaxID=45954 RepID=A0A9D4N2S6_DREPO|nr:hypothetical protein DPMN_012072 [Dreissena polymorpha]
MLLKKQYLNRSGKSSPHALNAERNRDQKITIEEKCITFYREDNRKCPGKIINIEQPTTLRAHEREVGTKKREYLHRPNGAKSHYKRSYTRRNYVKLIGTERKLKS